MPRFTAEAGAALVFLIGYVLILVWMLVAFLTHRIKWASRYSLLLFHVIIRVGSQVCGVAFGILGLTNKGVFLAYLILGAEGYFTLVLCAFRFLVSWHEHNLPSHVSWLEPPMDPTMSRVKKIRRVFYSRHPMGIMHTLLGLANTAIIIGGSFLSNVDYSNPDAPDTRTRLNLAKITRTAGQSVFLACNVGLLVAILITIIGERRMRTRIHPTLLLLLLAWLPLVIRGIFGVLQSAAWSLSYLNFNNYDSEGFTPRFTAIEYVLGVFTEWTACLLLNSTYYTSMGDPSKADVLAKDHTEMTPLELQA